MHQCLMAGTIMRFSFTPVLPGRPKLKPSPLSFRIVACSTTGTRTSIGADELRTQLLHLQAESDITRAKANNARLRLMRLSEAAENLQRRAAADIQSGKEDEARELLLQKRKVIQALEKSKIRIQVLDQLSEKLNEAISVRETQLIGTVASDLEVSSDDPCPVRIISPKGDNAEESIQTEVLDLAERDDEEPDFQIDVQAKNVPVEDQKKKKGIPTTSAENEDNIIRSLKGISSYADFLDHLDRQLLQIEEELVMVLRLSSLVMGGDQGQTSAKEQQTLVLLEDVRRVRERYCRDCSRKSTFNQVEILGRYLQDTSVKIQVKFTGLRLLASSVKHLLQRPLVALSSETISYFSCPNIFILPCYFH